MRQAIVEPYLLLCEGKQDKVFFEALFKAHNIGGFLVECPEKEEEGAEGITQYPTYFSGLIARTRPNLKGFIVTADCDDSANVRFDQVADWLLQKGYARPAAPLTIVPRQPPPFDLAVMVLLIPPNCAVGCLETLLYPAAANKWPALVPCVDDYWKCIGPTRHTPNQESKIKLRVTLAAANPRNPNLTLTRIWLETATALPLTDASFVPVVTAVKNFCATV